MVFSKLINLVRSLQIHNIRCKCNCKCNLFTHVTQRSLELVIKCTCMRSNWNLECWFLRRGENRRTWRKTSEQGREPTTNLRAHKPIFSRVAREVKFHFRLMTQASARKLQESHFRASPANLNVVFVVFLEVISHYYTKFNM